MFKNMLVYRVGPEWQPSLEQLEQAMDKARFVECGPTQPLAIGWIEPRGEAHAALVESVDNQWLMALKIEKKMVPASVIKRRITERAQQIEQTTGRKPGKRETKELKDEVLLDLLPMAFTRQSTVRVWLDPQARLLVVDAGSQATADEVVTMLVEGVQGLALALLQSQVSAGTAMAQWLVTREAPPGFSVDRECELKSQDEMKSVVRYGRHPLDIDEVQQHIEQGKLPTRLAMTWNERVSFVLTDTLQVKKLAFLDGVFEGNSQQDEGFEADAAIATGELRQLIPDLVEALGGELNSLLPPPLPVAASGA